jgi:hypothetical protein
MSAPVQPLTLQDKVKETPEQKAARKAAQAAMTPEQRAAFVLEKEKVKAKEAEEKAKVSAAKGILMIYCFICEVSIPTCIIFELMPCVSASETPEQKAARKAAKASMDPAAKVVLISTLTMSYQHDAPCMNCCA